jgi:hypothetical protein
MEPSVDQRRDARADTAILITLALGVLTLHIVTNGQYEFHRDELARLDAAEVAKVRDSLPADEIGQAAILAANYGEAGAINMYGPAYGLPKAISGMNSYWVRGYGDPPPQIVIVLGFSPQDVNQFFTSCELAGHITNQFSVVNEENKDHPYIFVCRKLRYDWPEFWQHFRYFG